MNNWLTSTVYAICNGMRQSGDYSPLPILADALQDAECDDAGILNQCRDPNITPISAQRLVCMVLGGELAAAVRWLDEFCEKYADEEYPDGYEWDEATAESVRILGPSQLSYEQLLTAVTSGKGLFFGFDIPDHVYEQHNELWNALRTVTGRTVDEMPEDWIFRCAC